MVRCAATVLPRHTVAQAGGWQGVRRLDDHYIQARGATIRDKLSRSELGAVKYERAEDAEHAPAPPL